MENVTQLFRSEKGMLRVNQWQHQMRYCKKRFINIKNYNHSCAGAGGRRWPCATAWMWGASRRRATRPSVRHMSRAPVRAYSASAGALFFSTCQSMRLTPFFTAIYVRTTTTTGYLASSHFINRPWSLPGQRRPTSQRCCRRRLATPSRRACGCTYRSSK